MRLTLVLIALLLAAPAFAREAAPDLAPNLAAGSLAPPDLSDGGEVRVPLSYYTALLNRLDKERRPAPAAYAIGQSEVAVTLSEQAGRVSAGVQVSVRIETFEDEWTLVPILPPGAALRHASVDGRPVQLVDGPDGLGWTSETAGTVTLRLNYGVDARSYEDGYALALPVPRAAATRLTLTYPGEGLDLAVVPSADLRSETLDGTTRVSATVPATSSILVSWRAPSQRPYAISRAHYRGELREAALVWTGSFQVEAFGGELITLPVMPNGVTLNDIRVDGEPATVLDENGHFATLLQGRGLHRVEVAFQVPVLAQDGPPRAHLSIPRIPVSRFDLVLPGKKEVKASPGAEVRTSHRESGEGGEDGASTLATTYIPMSDGVVFSWTEAVPDALRGQMRANASLYHAVHAEEGVLHVFGSVVYEITHGETNQLELLIPEAAQVNRISAPAGGVSDWAVAESEEAGRKKVNVFLDRPISGEFLLEVSYERLLGAEARESIAVPLLSADGVHRQRGMVALLSGSELSLDPVEEAGVSKVGENQLPAFIRERLAMTVAHTFKYTELRPRLLVAAVAPERKRGKFDARIDTLISLGDVTMKGSSTIEIDVKSGSLLDLLLAAPEDVNVLGVTGPSLRSHQVRAVEGGQEIALEFTREMEGQFRIEVNYERIMESAASESAVPTISVGEAEVEHGRIAVEALTAVEVRASTVEGLSGLDINELPQQLLLKTTNPILLAYRYVNAEPPFRLALRITRHKEIDVQVAAIEQASYKSLMTRDGLAVTTARLIVRNSRRQFLRLTLPPESQVWSVFVDGKPEKPAYASDGPGGPSGPVEEGSAVLIKMINSAEGFPVDIVYAAPVERIEDLGKVSSRLPRPDMVVTHSRWDVFLPVGPNYHAIESTMDLILRGVRVDPRVAGAEVLARAADAFQSRMGQPLRIVVPTQGIQFAFEKLYANQSPEEAGFSLRYASDDANLLGLLASALGTLLVWAAILAFAGRWIRLPRAAAAGLLAAGVALLGGSLGYLGTTPVPASALALVIAVLLALASVVQRIGAWRRARLAG